MQGVMMQGVARKSLTVFFAVCLVLVGCQTQPKEKEVDVLASSSSFTLINADTDKPISGFDPMPNGATLDLQKLPTRNLNVRANMGTAGSVRFALDGNKNYQTENNAPYALAGNSGSNYYDWTPSSGKHTLVATAYSGANAGGSVKSTLTLDFTVVSGSGASSPPPSSGYKDLTEIYVDASRGSDSNSGTSSSPLRTVGKGLERAVSNRSKGKGTRILLQPGTYREAINRYYNSSGKTIVIESVVPGKAVISGSDVWTGWSCSSGVCSHAWPYNWGTQPDPFGKGIGVLARRAEMVVVNGKNLTQSTSKSGLSSGSFAVDEGANKIYVKPPSGVDMNKVKVEVAVRGVLFKVGKLNDLVLKGLVFEHAATPFRKDAAVTLSAQKNVLLDNVTIRWNGNRGLWMGGDKYTLRDTTMHHNGGDGVEGYKLRDLLMEDTESSYNNWRGDRGGYYTWGVEKFLIVHGAVIKRHKAVGNLSRGLWFDSDSEDVVIDGAYVCNNKNDGLHVEAVQGPFTIKNSTFCNNGIHGVHLLASHGITLENNTISGNGGNAIEIANGSRDRVNFETGKRYRLDMKDLKVRNNKISSSKDLLWFVGLYGSDLANFIKTSSIDGNAYSHSKTDAAFRAPGFAHVNLTFGEWKSKTGKDKSSRFSR